jgi:hypothetical protein
MKKFCAPLLSLSKFRAFLEEFCFYAIDVKELPCSFPSCMSRVRFPSPAPSLKSIGYPQPDHPVESMGFAGGFAGLVRLLSPREVRS